MGTSGRAKLQHRASHYVHRWSYYWAWIVVCRSPKLKSLIFIAMLFSPKIRVSFFYVVSVVFLLTAVYHVVGLFYPVNDSPKWRHLLFIIINLFSVYGFLKRPQYFVWFVIVLLMQQSYSHGTSLVKQWVDKGQIDWISLFVLLLLPVALICLVEDNKSKTLSN